MKTILILSGGMDSTVLLYHLLRNLGREVKALGINYGQRHRRELQSATVICKNLGIEYRVADLTALRQFLGGSSQTDDSVQVPYGHYAEDNMKVTVVPNRNALMLSVAAAWAISSKYDSIAYAAHAGDHCLAAETRVLTPAGPVPIEALRSGDPLFSYNPKTKQVEEDSVVKVVKKGIPEVILKITLANGEVVFATSEHKMYKLRLQGFDNQYGWIKEITKQPAETLAPKDYLLLFKASSEVLEERSLPSVEAFLREELASWEAQGCRIESSSEEVWIVTQGHRLTSIKTSSLPEIVEAIGWYTAEGWSSKAKKSHDSRFSSYLCQSARHNLPNTEHIGALLQTISGLAKVETKLFNGEPNEVTFFVSGTLSALFQRYGRRSKDKELSPQLMTLLTTSSLLRECFLDAVIKGDGHRMRFADRGDAYSVTTFSPKLMQQLEFLFKLTGAKTSVHDGKRTLSIYYPGPKARGMDFAGLYTQKVKSIEVVHNTSPVYDVEVRTNHNFFAGEFGSVLVSNSQYPDCRPDFVAAMRNLLTTVDWEPIQLEAPFQSMTKAEIAKLGASLSVPFEQTWSCYEGGYTHCGLCGTCQERVWAFQTGGVPDPTVYAGGRVPELFPAPK